MGDRSPYSFRCQLGEVIREMFPEGMSLCTLSVGSAVSMVDGVAHKITAKAYPLFGSGVKHLVWRDGTIIPDVAQSASAGPGETIDFVVPHVDQAGFYSPSGKEAKMWAYRVHVTVVGKTWEKQIQPLVGQGSIAVDLQPSEATASPVLQDPAAVLSVNGKTGHITISDTTDTGPVAAAPMQLIAYRDGRYKMREVIR